MPFVLRDRIKETTTTTGTGTVTLAGAVAGFQSFSAVGNANTTYYAIVAQTPGEWEVGIGTYTSAGTLLARNTVLESSNAGALVNFSAGTKDVFVTYPGEVAVVASNGLGTLGHVLTSSGPDAPATWQAAVGGNPSFVSVNATYTATAADNGKIISCGATTTITVNLPSASVVGVGFNCWIVNNSTIATAGVSVDPFSTETIDGIQSMVLQRGEGVQVVSNGSSGYATLAPKDLRGYVENIPVNATRPNAVGDGAIALGAGASAQGSGSTALGGAGTGTNGTNAFAAGKDESGNASLASSNATTALGGATASFTGAFAVGRSASASGTQSNALGFRAQSSGGQAFAVSTTSNNAGAVASGSSAVAIGAGATASQTNSVAFGNWSSSTISGKWSYASGNFALTGDAQSAKFILRRQTANATPLNMSTSGGAENSTNVIVLSNNSALVFSGIVVARQSAAVGTATAAWRVEGVIRREGTAASTTLIASAVTAIDNTPGWGLALSANTTLGCLNFAVTGAAISIRWVANIEIAETIFA